MCKALKISESGYYRWLKNQAKQTARELLTVKIIEIISEHPDNDNYGIERIMTALSYKGINTSRQTVYRAMRDGGLLHKSRRPHGITKATTEIQEKENLIKRDFRSDKPKTKLLTDITEVQCADGKLYISPVMDCFNGEIVALEMRENMKKELCIATVKQLGRLKNAILHSDRGSQYTSDAFRSELKKIGLVQSLSGTGHCYDNARMESFFATLKKEKLYRIPTYKMTREEVKTIVFRYIFGYYNTLRITSFNPSGLPPVAYRKQTCKVVA
jgi:transposase InsO family protein